MNQPTLWGGIGGTTGNDHPETSYEAGRKVKSGSQKHQILRAMYQHRDGVTAYDLRNKIRNGAGDPISNNQIATRLGEMREQGLVKYRRDGLTGLILERETTPSNTGLVQELTKWGRNHASG
jgi:DNA-binding HxlR family transcriptional regulator